MQVTTEQLNNLNQLYNNLPSKLIKGQYACKLEHWDYCNYCVLGVALKQLGVDDATLIDLGGAINEEFERPDLRYKLMEHLGLTVEEMHELQHANDTHDRNREAVIDVLVDLIRKKEKMVAPETQLQEVV